MPQPTTTHARIVSQSQRSIAEQVASGRSSRREWAGRAALVCGAVLVVAAVAAVIARSDPRPAVAPECAARYHRARSAADTAIVDAVTLDQKDPSFRTCGSQRDAIARGLTP